MQRKEGGIKSPLSIHPIQVVFNTCIDAVSNQLLSGQQGDESRFPGTLVNAQILPLVSAVFHVSSIIFIPAFLKIEQRKWIILSKQYHSATAADEKRKFEI